MSGQQILASDFPRWGLSPVTGAQYNSLIDQIVTVLTSGNYDLDVNTVNAVTLIGDISQCTGFPSSDVSLTASTTIAAGKIVRQSSSQAALADNGSTGGITNILGIATNAASTGETVAVQTQGTVTGLSGLSQGTTYYVGTSGDLTSSRPSARAVAIGYAISSTSLFLTKFSSPTTTISDLYVQGISSDVAVNTNKFTVTASSGNTSVAGTLGVTGALTANASAGITGVNTAKAFVSIQGSSGTPTILGTAFNVTSITDCGVGNYVLNFTNNLSSANYTVVCTTKYGSNDTNITANDATASAVNAVWGTIKSVSGAFAKSTSQVGIRLLNGSAAFADTDVDIAIFQV